MFFELFVGLYTLFSLFLVTAMKNQHCFAFTYIKVYPEYLIQAMAQHYVPDLCLVAQRIYVEILSIVCRGMFYYTLCPYYLELQWLNMLLQPCSLAYLFVDYLVVNFQWKYCNFVHQQSPNVEYQMDVVEVVSHPQMYM